MTLERTPTVSTSSTEYGTVCPSTAGTKTSRVEPSYAPLDTPLSEIKQVNIAETENCAAFLQSTMVSMLQMFEQKNADYGNAYLRTLQVYGPVHGIGMLNHKLKRLESLLLLNDEQKVKDESVEDTLKDLANYALLLLYFKKYIAN